jgi:hypothetical protein
MSVTVLGDLPIELWLELFIYFTWVELDSTWLQWNLNRRIRTLALAAQSRVTFALSPTSLKTHEHPRMAPRIASLVLNDSILGSEILTRWVHQGPSFFPRLRRCTIHYDLVGRYVRANIVRVIDQCAPTLRHLVFYFKSFETHNRLWSRLIRQHISLRTMELIVIKGQ